MGKKVTMGDIAKELCTSVVTVSNALSGRKGVSEELRSRILEKAEELGYHLSGPETRSGRSVMLGMVSSQRYIKEGVSFYWELYQNAVQAAAAQGVLTMLEIFDEEGEGGGWAAAPALAEKDGIDGLIVIGRMENRVMERIRERVKIPVVLLDFYRDGYRCDAVLSDNYGGGYQITKYLADRGHREIGFVGTGRTSRNIVERYYGFCRCMCERGLPIRGEWLLEDRDLCTEQPLIRLPEVLPGAFVCGSDYTAGFLYGELAARGLRVPEDISVIGYDDYLFGNTFSEKLTSYHVDMSRMAQEAVRMALQRIRFPGQPYCVRYVASGITERSSVKNLKQE